jgi:hypothetical protein
LWNEVAKLSQKMIQFVLLGDEGQLDPIKNVWAGCPVRGSINQIDLYRDLTGGFSVQMTENRRSDPPLFEFCTGLRAGRPDERPFQEALAEARARFPVKPGMPDYTLCVPHRIRMEVNRKQNAFQKPADAVFYKAPPAKRGENSAQDMWVYPGQTLVGAGGAVRKGIFVHVSSVSQEWLVLDISSVSQERSVLDIFSVSQKRSVQNISSAHQKGCLVSPSQERLGLTRCLRLTKAAAVKCLRLAHAITIAGCQGLTLAGRVRVIPHESMGVRELYVACSRATAAGLLEVA